MVFHRSLLWFFSRCASILIPIWYIERKKTDNNCCRWSDLPDDILQLISRRLGLLDSIRASAVCRSWRSISEKKQQIPLILSSSKNKKGIQSFLNLIDRRIWDPTMLSEARGKWICGSSYGWWILSYGSYGISLFNPNSRYEIKLPKISYRGHFFIRKAILSCAPTTATGNDCTVLAIIHQDQWEWCLAFCRPGDEEWFVFRSPNRLSDFEDIVFFKGKFYTMHFPKGVEIVAFDIGDKHPPEAKHFYLEGLPAESIIKRIHLVEWRGELLLVLWCPRVPRGMEIVPQRFKIEIFRVVFGRGSAKAVRMESLGDSALFMGSYHFSSVSSARILDGKGNHIYFIQTNGDLGAFDLTDGKYTHFPTKLDPRYASHAWVTADPW